MLNHATARVAISALILVAGAALGAACGDDDAQTGPNVGGTTLPATEQGGTILREAVIVFEGERWKPVAVTPLDQAEFNDEFTEAGAVEDANVELTGEVTVYRRSNDESGIYTQSLTQAQGGAAGGEDRGNLLYRWERIDVVEEFEDREQEDGGDDGNGDDLYDDDLEDDR